MHCCVKPLVFAAFAAMTTIAGAAVCLTETVIDTDVARQAENTPPTRNWVLYTRTPESTGTFEAGPAAPPAGSGSLELQTPTAADKVSLFNFDHVGTPLSSVNAIGYATYRDPASTGPAHLVPSINIQVDVNGDAEGGFTTLVFEPVYNTGQGAVVPGEWQTWDAYAGGSAIWWSTREIPGVCAADCFVTWDTIVASNPDAVIVGGFGVNQGSGNAGVVANADALTLGYDDQCVTYDLELFRVAPSADACKDGGWRTLARADGSAFRNQGDCVSYAQTGQ
jgi:hypothetical protein